MSDGFDLADAFAPPSNPQTANQPQNPNWANNPWGANPGAPAGGQQYPGYPGPGQPWPGAGQQFPGYPGPGQPYPGAPGAGQQYPGAPGQPTPGMPGAGQQYPGAPGQPTPGVPGAGQQYPGAPGQPTPGMPGAGQQFPGAPGQPTPGAPGAGQSFPLFPGAGQTFPGFGPGPTPAGPTAPQQPGAPAGPQTQPQTAGVSGPINIPFDLPLPSGALPRLLINVQGAVKGNARRFTFDFKRKTDVAFHFNVRFDEKPTVIVRNSMVKDRWGSEERQCPRFPFEVGKPFQIHFLVESDCFKVAVNGAHLLEFKHRLKELNEINAVSAYGDITLNSVVPSMI